jgi:CRISPR type IV-associated protein Csf2
MSKTNRIEGIIRLSSPLHCASYSEKNAQGANITHTMTMNIVNTDGTRDTMPYFPGNDLRGRLRRKAAGFVIPALVNGKKVPLDLYVGLTCGASNNQPENDLSVEEALRSAKNVYMGLFGGGKRLLRSRFSVQDLVPITQSTINAGLVPEKYAISDAVTDAKLVDSAFKLLHTFQFVHVNDAYRVMRAEEMERSIENFEDNMPEYQAQIIKERAEKKAGEGGKKLDIDNMMGIRAITPGAPMYFRLDFDNAVSDAQVGIMLMGLAELVNEQKLGGWSRAGMGRFNVVEMSLYRNSAIDSVNIFDKDDGDGYRLAENVNQYTALAREEIGRLSMSDMLSYFTASKPEKAEEAA